jgi:hypothetical protein
VGKKIKIKTKGFNDEAVKSDWENFCGCFYDRLFGGMFWQYQAE